MSKLFEGWFALGRGDRIKPGDSWVWTGEADAYPESKQVPCAENHVKEDVFDESLESLAGGDDWVIYRRFNPPKPAISMQDVISANWSEKGEVSPKRKEGEPEKRQKPTKYKDGDEMPDPRTIVSLFGTPYEKSTAAEWKGYEGAGWLHSTEARLFKQSYQQCCVSTTWHKNSFMIATGYGLYVNNRELKNGTWEKDVRTGYAFPKNEMVDVLSGDGTAQRVSTKTRDSHYFQCDMDHKWHPNNTKIKVTGSEKYKLVSQYNVHRTEKFASCEHCNRIFERLAGEVISRPEFHCNLCGSCFEVALTKDIIKAHNFTAYPKSIFTAPPKARITKEAIERTMKVMKEFNHPLKDEPWDDSQLRGVMLYGVEVETEFTHPGAGGRRARLALQAWQALGKDFCIIKHDGSLSGTRDIEPGEKIHRGGENGFEIVTAPCDLATHRERWVRMEEMKDYKELRAWDTNTCGMHVHVSRAPMTALQICRITYMINHPKLKKFIELVAGRCAARYNKFIPKKITDGMHPEMDKDKYTAINIKHHDTVEFRIFRGTVNWRHIIRNLEFVEAVVRFCYPADRSIRELVDHEAFVRFASANKKLWPELNRWLDIQAEFQKMVKANPGAFGPKDERTKRGEKPIEVMEASEPKASDIKEQPKPETKTRKGKITYAAIVDDLEPSEDERL